MRVNFNGSCVLALKKEEVQFIACILIRATFHCRDDTC